MYIGLVYWNKLAEMSKTGLGLRNNQKVKLIIHIYNIIYIYNAFS